MVSHTSVSLEDSLSRLSHVGLSSATASRSQIIMRWLDFNGRIESQLSALTSAQHSKEMLRSRLEGTQLEIDCKRGIQDWTTCSQECLRWWAAGLVPKRICRCRYASSTAWKYDKCFHLQMCNPIIAGDDSFLVGLMMRQQSKTSICGQCWQKFKKMYNKMLLHYMQTYPKCLLFRPMRICVCTLKPGHLRIRSTFWHVRKMSIFKQILELTPYSTELTRHLRARPGETMPPHISSPSKISNHFLQLCSHLCSDAWVFNHPISQDSFTWPIKSIV